MCSNILTPWSRKLKLRSPITLVICILFTAFFLFSCTIKQEASVARDGSGRVTFRFEVQQFFADTIIDMAAFSGDEEAFQDGKFFDVEKTREEFREMEAIDLVSLSSPSPNVMEGEFTFDDVEAVFKSEEELTQSGIITFNRRGGESTLKVHLDNKNFRQVSAFSPALNNPLFEMFGPQENDDTTEEEYLEMIEFAFGEEGVTGLKASSVELLVTVQGDLVSQTGGKKIGENQVLFTIPLIDFLLLQKPLDYAITFK
jgi:hypothetical protein